MTLLLELTDGFGSVFGAGRGVDGRAAKARDDEKELLVIAKTNPFDSAALHLCDPDFDKEGQALVDRCRALSGDVRIDFILKVINATDFSNHLRHQEMRPLSSMKHMPRLVDIINMLSERFVETVPVDVKAEHALYQALGLGLTESLVNQIKDGAASLDFPNSVCNELANTRNQQLTITRLKNIGGHSVTLNRSIRSVSILTSYNYSDRICGRYLTDEEWNEVMDWWKTMYASKNDYSYTSMRKLVCKAIRLHGTRIKPSKEHRDYKATWMSNPRSAASLRSYRKLDDLRGDLSEKNGRTKTVMPMSSEHRQLLANISKVQAKLEVHPANILPHRIKAQDRY